MYETPKYIKNLINNTSLFCDGGSALAPENEMMDDNFCFCFVEYCGDIFLIIK